jgi:chromosome segregation ATPase
MPQELTPEQRLTQIEKLLESAVKLSHSNTAKIDALTEKVEHNIQSIDALTEKVEANTESISIQDTKIDRLTEQMARATEMFIDSMGVMRIMQNNFEAMQHNIETIQNNIETMQGEIRGLQVENRRILDRLFGEES